MVYMGVQTHILTLDPNFLGTSKSSPNGGVKSKGSVPQKMAFSSGWGLLLGIAGRRPLKQEKRPFLQVEDLKWITQKILIFFDMKRWTNVYREKNDDLSRQNHSLETSCCQSGVAFLHISMGNHCWWTWQTPSTRFPDSCMSVSIVWASSHHHCVPGVEAACCVTFFYGALASRR